ncbi:MAG TPA: flagellar export chaperone FlgN [Euzebyales bacterium]|nr:flagellar export chaperone FlgN [Euzebyales bacterium]
MRPRTAALDTLIDTITAERHVVEYLLFKLITLKLLFVHDERRFIEKAANEAERVISNLRQAEERRDQALQVVADEWDVSADELTLTRLAREAPEPSGKTFRDLQRSLRGLTDEIEAVLEDNRKLAEGGLNDVRTVLDAVVGNAAGDLYTDAGRRYRTQAQPMQLDKAL